MLNYMRAEFYKLLRRKYIYIFTAVLLLCEALLISGWIFTNARGNDMDFYTTSGILVSFFAIGMFATLMIADIVFSEQHKLSTLKNELSYGIPRSRIYFGKLMVETIVAIVICAIAIVFYDGLCWIFMIHNEMDGVALQMVGYCVAAALPLWLGAQAVSHAVLFNVKSEFIASGTVVCIFLLPQQIIYLLAELVNEKLMVIYRHMPAVLIDTSHQFVGDGAFLARCWLIGAAWVAVATALGYYGFRRKEIV